MKMSKREREVLEAAIELKTDDPDAAIDLLLPVRQEFGGNPVIAGLLGSLLWSRKRPREAVPHLRSCLQSSPNSENAHRVLFHALWDQGRKADAVAALRDAVRRTGSSEFADLLVSIEGASENLSG